MELIGYTDSDWGSDPTDRKLLSGYIFHLTAGPISWKCRKQQTVARSSTEAEYLVANLAVQESIWLRRLMTDLGFPQNRPTRIYEDNQGCIALSKNSSHHDRTKHIDIKHHFIHGKVEDKTLELVYCPSKQNIADILTKGVPRPLFEDLRSRLGICPFFRMSGGIGITYSLRALSSAHKMCAFFL